MRIYIPALDGMRAVAVLAVFTAHGTYGRIHGGFMGVEMFFVLSGFLIATLLMAEYQREHRISIKHFYLRRGARLLPALGLVTVLVLGLYATDSSLLPAHEIVTSIPKVWLYVGNWFAAEDFGQLGLLGHTWSLAIEEQFYLLWPIVLVFALGRGLSVRQIIVGILGLAALSYVVRYLVVHHGSHEDFDVAYYSSHTRAGALLIGCALALVLTLPEFRHRMAALSGRGVALGAVVVLGVAMATLWPYRTPAYAGGLLAVAVATAAVIAHVVLHESALTRWLAHPVAVWIGKRSYGLYLFHFPVFTYVTDLRLGVGGHPMEFVARMTLAFALAAASYRFVEQPILQGTKGLTVAPAAVARG